MTILKLMILLNESLYRNTQQVYMNELISTPAEVITSDLTSAGYGMSTSKNFYAAETQMYFWTDTGDGIPIEIHYYLSGTELIREINGGPAYYVTDKVKKFKLNYFDSLGVQLSYGNPRRVKSVFIELILESINTMMVANAGSTDTSKIVSTWKKHIFPKNL